MISGGNDDDDKNGSNLCFDSIEEGCLRLALVYFTYSRVEV